MRKIVWFPENHLSLSLSPSLSLPMYIYIYIYIYTHGWFSASMLYSLLWGIWVSYCYPVWPSPWCELDWGNHPHMAELFKLCNIRPDMMEIWLMPSPDKYSHKSSTKFNKRWCWLRWVDSMFWHCTFSFGALQKIQKIPESSNRHG